MHQEETKVPISNDEIESYLNGQSKNNNSNDKSQQRNLRKLSSRLSYEDFKTRFNQGRPIKYYKSNKEGLLVGDAEQQVNGKMLFIDVWKSADLGHDVEKQVTLYVDDKGAYVAFVQEARELVDEE